MKIQNHPIDAKENPEAFGFWLGRVFEIVRTSSNISSSNFEEAKQFFASKFPTTFPGSNKIEEESAFGSGDSLNLVESEFKNVLQLAEKNLLDAINN
jgi:hypothetical protein